MKVKKLEIFWSKIGSNGWKWSSLNAPGTQCSLYHPILNLGEISFLNIGPSGVLRMDPQYESEKVGKFSEQNLPKVAAYGPFWTHQGLWHLCFKHFWVKPFSLFTTEQPPRPNGIGLRDDKRCKSEARCNLRKTCSKATFSPSFGINHREEMNESRSPMELNEEI